MCMSVFPSTIPAISTLRCLRNRTAERNNKSSKNKRLCNKINTISTKNYSRQIYEAEMLSNRLVLRRFATDETAITIMAVELQYLRYAKD